MNTFSKLLLSVLALAASATAAQAAPIYAVGEGLTGNWSIDDAPSILPSAGNADIYTATLYIAADKQFKFLTEPDFGATQIAPAEGATIDADGNIEIQTGHDLGNFTVAESANYVITVNTATLKASFVKAAYQASEVKYATLYIVGAITTDAWMVNDQMPLTQTASDPCELTTGTVEAKAGSFKIATSLWGARDWNQAYFFFRDEADADKMALNQDGDLQWNIDQDGKYIISVNTLTDAVSIKPATSTGITDTVAAPADITPEYYTLQGIRVANPQAGGIYIRRCGTSVAKVIF